MMLVIDAPQAGADFTAYLAAYNFCLSSDASGFPNPQLQTLHLPAGDSHHEVQDPAQGWHLREREQLSPAPEVQIYL